MRVRLLQPASLVLFGIVALMAVFILFAMVRWLRRVWARRPDPAVSGHIDSANNQQFVLATFQGVIQRLKEQELELERLHRLEKERADLSQKLSENITRNMPTGVITINRAGLITGSNPAAKEILQLEVFENMHYRQIATADDGFFEMIEACLSAGKKFHRAEKELAVANGAKKILGISISPIESGRSEITGAVCLVSDLTELTALQKLVKMKEGLALLGEMSAGIAHEFKNSLATLSGYAQILQDESLPASTRQHLGMIGKETAHLSETINKFLAFVKPEEVRKREFDLTGVLRECIMEMQIDPRFRRICFEFQGSETLYQGDEPLLRSAFLNLLLNAAESVAEDERNGKVACQVEKTGQQTQFRIRVRVIDNGCGISAENLEKIFIPFFTSKSAGTGLGLALVQKVVLMHDGRIDVGSSPGGGTCFEVLI
jgi:two-component system, NtrC family, sensor histidine kinase AtoS